MRKIILIFTMAALFCLGCTGCDRTPPEVSGIKDVVTIDCETKYNIETYLNNYLKITDETGDGIIEYKLEELEHAISLSDENIYDVHTGEIDTSKPGEYNVRVLLKDKSNNKSEFDFTLVLEPLKMESTTEEVIELNCGTEFNVLDYLNENVTIKNQAGDVEYRLDDFDYTIDCDETVCNLNTGDFNTSKFGKYPVKIEINSTSIENNMILFTVALNPLEIQKGYYVYESSLSFSGYEYLGFCEYKNISSENLTVKSIKFQYYDKDGVIVGSSDMPSYSLECVKSEASGYALDIFSSCISTISSADEIVRVDIIIDYGKATGADKTSLDVGDVEITNSCEYNMSGFAGTAVIHNQYDKDVESYYMLAGMYNADGSLVGVMDSMTSEGIAAGAKARCTAFWLPDSRDIPDQVTSVKASARVASFSGEY